MTTRMIRRWEALAALAFLALLTAASDAPASTVPGCHGLSPASAENCAADVFAP